MQGHFASVTQSLYMYLYRADEYIVIFYTIVPSSPMNVTLQPIPDVPNQLRIDWTPPSKMNGIIIAYTVYCRTQDIIDPNLPTVRAIVNASSLNAVFSTGLKAFTSYVCFVTANTSIGEGDASQLVTSTTDESGEGGSCILKF